jgi:hypothetical protein
MTTHAELLRPHVDVTTCSKCRKKFESGDRIVEAYIFHRSAPNPLNVVCRGAELMEEYEFIHADCNDTKLLKGNYVSKIVVP